LNEEPAAAKALEKKEIHQSAAALEFETPATSSASSSPPRSEDIREQAF
jgi:hypothetical protein